MLLSTYGSHLVKSCQKNNNNRLRQVCVSSSCETCSSSPVVDMSMHGALNSGAAKRRRDRRLRMHWRHEQLSAARWPWQQPFITAVMLGPCRTTLYGARGLPGQGEWGREQNYTAKTWDPSTPQPELFSLYEEEPGGVRPGSVTDPAPQERVERHVVEYRIEACPFVQILDAPVPQGGNQLRFARP